MNTLRHLADQLAQALDDGVKSTCQVADLVFPDCVLRVYVLADVALTDQVQENTACPNGMLMLRVM